MKAKVKDILKKLVQAIKLTLPTLIPLLRQGLNMFGSSLATVGLISTSSIEFYVGLAMAGLGVVWKWIEMYFEHRAKKKAAK